MLGLIGRLVGGAVSPLVDQATSYGASLLRKLALFLVAALSFLVVAVALTVAFGMWVASLAGPIIGVLAVAGLYLVVAAAALVLALRSGKPPVRSPAPEMADADAEEPSRSARIDQFTAPILDILQRFGFRREQIAVLAGASLAKQLKPIPLVGLAIVAGFLIGRLWKGWDALFSTNLVTALLGLVGLGRGRERDGDVEGSAAA